MPFVRFSRDKRGYEYVYLVEASTRNRQAPPHILYWYRTPPGVKVGREPFDAEVRLALESRYPDIRFDWKAITSAQPPSAEGDMWRERRRAKREARRAQSSEPIADVSSGANREDPEALAATDAVDTADATDVASAADAADVIDEVVEPVGPSGADELAREDDDAGMPPED